MVTVYVQVTKEEAMRDKAGLNYFNLPNGIFFSIAALTSYSTLNGLKAMQI